ncbi:hypothetical protein F5Y04DRAFT_279051 [Hypomontagnella monticulosa]|nr:hypothetical protein F5Y04DRAFT_279051 [Hypomontagnella monticulosa]
MLSQFFIVGLLGSAALASPINLGKRDTSIVFLDVPVVEPEKRDPSTSIVFLDVPVEDKVEEKRDTSIVFLDVPVEESS